VASSGESDVDVDVDDIDDVEEEEEEEDAASVRRDGDESGDECVRFRDIAQEERDQKKWANLNRCVKVDLFRFLSLFLFSLCGGGGGLNAEAQCATRERVKKRIFFSFFFHHFFLTL
jgi:hypothetical protein